MCVKPLLYTSKFINFIGSTKLISRDRTRCKPSSGAHVTSSRNRAQLRNNGHNAHTRPRQIKTSLIQLPYSSLDLLHHSGRQSTSFAQRNFNLKFILKWIMTRLFEAAEVLGRFRCDVWERIVRQELLFNQLEISGLDLIGCLPLIGPVVLF